MGIFGQLDAKKIKDNPFFVEEGEYRAQIVKAFIQENKQKEKHQLIIEYKITDGRNKGKNVRDWFDVFPEITEEEYFDLDEEAQGAIDAANSAVKRRLCGFTVGKKEYPGLGVDVEDLDDSWDPKSLVDLEVDIGVVNRGDDNEFSNISWARVAED
jgi:hypothetical protein